MKFGRVWIVDYISLVIHRACKFLKWVSLRTNLISHEKLLIKSWNCSNMEQHVYLLKEVILILGNAEAPHPTKLIPLINNSLENSWMRMQKRAWTVIMIDLTRNHDIFNVNTSHTPHLFRRVYTAIHLQLTANVCEHKKCIIVPPFKSHVFNVNFYLIIWDNDKSTNTLIFNTAKNWRRKGVEQNNNKLRLYSLMIWAD